jgi:hypothetical protein
MAALPLGADGQFFTATRAAAGDHGAAVLRFHSRKETVGLGAVTVIGLKGAFRHNNSIQ